MKLNRNKLLIAETAFVLSAAALYVIVYLVRTYLKWERLYGDALYYYEFPAKMIRNDIYGFTIRTDVQYPVIAAAVLLALGWFVFHTAVIQRAAQKIWDLRLFLAVILTLALIAGGLFVYHYFRDYFRFYLDRYSHPDGIKIYSLFRKRTLATDFLGVLVIFGLLELAIGACHRFRKLLCNEDDGLYRLMAFLPMFLLAALLLCAVYALRLSTPLWTGSLQYFLYFGGLVLIIWLMQELITVEYKPEMVKVSPGKFYVFVTGLIFICLVLNFLLWASLSYFTFHWLIEYIVGLILTLFASLLIAVLRRTSFNRKSKLERFSYATSAELAQLREQLNPHFLFNALNSLYTAAHREKSPATAEGIQRLGDIMRFILNDNNLERIPLAKELEYLENYLYIQRLRVDESQGVDIKINLPADVEQAYIAPMMLIPFVENAFKHGISHLSPSWIHIELMVISGKLQFSVKNSLHQKSANDPEITRVGIGLPNIRKRLQLIYPHRYTLEISKTDSEYGAVLTLQLW